MFLYWYFFRFYKRFERTHKNINQKFWQLNIKKMVLDENQKYKLKKLILNFPYIYLVNFSF